MCVCDPQIATYLGVTLTVARDHSQGCILAGCVERACVPSDFELGCRDGASYIILRSQMDVSVCMCMKGK